MSEGKETNLTLVQFLELLDTEHEWMQKSELFDSYCDKANLPTSYFSGDWVEISPALEAIRMMIERKVFREG
jgi:hypothetical protein